MTPRRLLMTLKKMLYGQSVSRVFIVKILIFSGFITLFLTSLQLFRDYRYGLEVIEQRFKQIELSNMGSINQSMWTYNWASLQVQLDGLIRQPDISYLEIQNSEGITVLAVGEPSVENVLERQFTLTHQHRNKLYPIGYLKIQASLLEMYSRLYDTLIVILLSQAIKTFLVSLFIIYIFNALVIRHLKKIVTQISRADQNPIGIMIDRPVTEFNQKDELNTLVNALNQLNTQIGVEHRKLEHLATVDSLTNLPNRHYLAIKMAMLIGARRQFWLMLLDVNDFKNVNDTLGHGQGDEVLREIGRRFNQLQTTDCFIARLGGDEFACIISGEWAAEDAAEHILSAFRNSFLIQSIRMQLSVSVGVVAYPSQAKTKEMLMKYADIAMYHAKNNHIPFAVFNPQFDEHSIRQLALMTEVKAALDNDEFVLYYQTQVDAKTNKVSGVEALIRWQHPTLGFVPPDQFIKALELGGHINQLTCWVLKQVLTDMPSLQRIYDQDITFSINISSLNLLDDNFVESVRSILSQFSGSPALIMEITENVFLGNFERARQTMLALYELGVQFSIDDYGTGYSSLNYLCRLPVTELKIDRFFITDMEKDVKHYSIVLSTISMAHSLGLRVVAEGCETKISVAMLKELNCDHLQGFFFCLPLPIEHLANLSLEENTADLENNE